MRSPRFIILSVILAVFILSAAVVSGYNACTVPTTVGFGTKPNVMICMDFSGSMQEPAYLPFDDSVNANWDYLGSDVMKVNIELYTPYDPKNTYYGLCDSDVYYVYNKTSASNPYFEPATAQPVSWITFTNESSEAASGGGIWFEASGHGFQVGDVVAFRNLTSHTGLNAATGGDGLAVLEVSGTKFRVNYPWNGQADKRTGSVIKRVLGKVSSGLSGNILNWTATSRVDAALKALIGGKAFVDASGCYLQGQGAQRHNTDSSLLLAKFNVRPGTMTDPDDSSGGSYTSKDIFIDIEDAGYSGYIRNSGTNADPASVKRTERAEVWWFYVDTANTSISIEMDSSDMDPLLYLYSGRTPTTAGYLATNDDISGSNKNAKITYTIATPGYYCIEATTNGSTSGGRHAYGAYTLSSNMVLGFDQSTYPNHNGVLGSRIGSLNDARFRVKIPAAQRTGVVQQTFAQVRYGFTYFQGGTNGKILVGCNNTDMSKLINAISGIGSDTVNGSTLDFTKVYPYNGTPTGPALREVYHYFAQDSATTLNPAFTGRATTQYDPWYDSSGAVPCRKSFVVLISDGNWNSGEDPIGPVQDMVRGVSGSTTGDLRSATALPGNQIVKTFAFYAFDQGIGKRPMKWIGMFGGLNDKGSACDSGTLWPYGAPASVDSNSNVFKITNCPSDTDDPCCDEWAAKKVAAPTGVGDETQGYLLPDNYFEVSSGAILQQALLAAISSVMETVSSASAVATVSQQHNEGDFVVRGAFEAVDPNNTVNYLWRGHLEVFWAHTPADDLPAGLDPAIMPCKKSGQCYDFEWAENVGLLCKDIPDSSCATCPPTAHCWDAGKKLKDRLDALGTTSDRLIFTGYDRDSSGTIGKGAITGSPPTTVTGDVILFNEANVATIGPWLKLPTSPTNLDTTANRTDLISWVRGINKSQYRDRNGWVLGDIAYSSPVVVGIPSIGAVAPSDPDVASFYTYRNNLVTTPRKKMVYVGANDGMIHAFVLAVWDSTAQKWISRPDDPDGTSAEISLVGKELWAYIPSNLVSELYSIANTTYGSSGGCSHRNMVDLSPRAWDVYITDPNNTSQKTWRTVLIGGERGGGDTFFCLDVTDPEQPRLVWEYSVLKDRVAVDYDNSNNRAYLPFVGSYDNLKTLPLSWSTPHVGRVKLPDTLHVFTGNPNTTTGSTTPQGEFLAAQTGRKRHVAFMGGGMRIFNSGDLNITSGSTGGMDLTKAKNSLFFPQLLAIDIDTGQNMFKWIWPFMIAQSNYPTTSQTFPLETNGSNTIPYALADPVSLDLVDETNSNDLNPDGFVEHVFVGDLNGNFYGMKLRQSASSSSPWISLNVWSTKTIGITNDLYRGNNQPITVMPAPTLSSDGTTVRLIFGTGKYDDVYYSGADDKSDTEKESLYNLKVPINLDLNGGTIKQVYTTGLYYEVAKQCTGTTLLSSGCKWVWTNGDPDCCVGTSSTRTCGPSPVPCWACVYDFGTGNAIDPVTGAAISLVGERVTEKALVAGGVVFVTTYVPASNTTDPTAQCTTYGNGFLYAFPYECGYFGANFKPFSGQALFNANASGGDDGTKRYGFRKALGQGVPSRPVLDSSGTRLIVQVSGNVTSTDVNLPLPGAPLIGWKLR